MAYRHEGSEILVNTTTEGGQFSPKITRLDSGGYVVVWRELFGGHHGQKFDADGNKVGAEFDAEPPGSQSDSEVAGLAGGGFVMTWVNEGAIRAQLFSAAGAKLGAELAVSSETRGMGVAQVAALASGGFVVVWTKHGSLVSSEEYLGIFVQVFSATGARVGPERQIAAEGPAGFGSLDVAALATGGFVVTWASKFGTGDDTSGTAIKAQVFGPGGNEIGAELIVNTTTSGDQIHPAVTGLPSGDFVIAWTDFSQTGGDTDRSAVRSQLFHNEAAPIEGTPDDDKLYGTDESDIMLGRAGNDAMAGYGGDDMLNGGAGGDYMEGGLGNDIYVVDNWRDTVEEYGDQGTDEIRTALGTRTQVYTIPDHVENLTGTSAAAQAVEGNGLDNIIIMGAGNDLLVLDDGGDDVVAAGGGNDFIYYGNAWTSADRADGGAGTDTIGLIGSTSIVLTAGSMIGIERLALYTGGPGAPAHYDIKMAEANVAGGQQLFVTAASLKSNETLTFNGISEHTGRFVVHGGAGDDRITGGQQDDFLIGNAGSDLLSGNEGADILVGGLGADQLRGGDYGGDVYLYRSSAESTSGSEDHILEFRRYDRIDLSAIDANGEAADGNSAFTFIGGAAFGNVAGQLRAYQSGADWFVEGDVDGDGNADLVIQVTIYQHNDNQSLVAGDFVL
jgi:Ca2+-binding RTX toxin-like protein